ncbi:hypothetical protein FOL47_004772 [Perkinsus chesapeaki]|uniref:Uncharacterized protein n=1 Tax=Perkinsus chesapeaki TaxID=330153 RepID=A0A7J6MYX7_PERCH|nr:hypothetical protein FOL47_004772 [Perkinsus chesapeaki]
MISIRKVLFVAAFGFAASEIMFKNTMYSRLSQTTANDGDTYHRPKGTCHWDGAELPECECAGILVFALGGAIQVCTQQCSDENKCPTPPEGRTESCIDGLCFLTCSSNDDECLEGALCWSFFGGSGLCMFRPSLSQ